MAGRFERLISRRELIRWGLMGTGAAAVAVGLGTDSGRHVLWSEGAAFSGGAGPSPPVGPSVVTTLDADIQRALDQAIDLGSEDAGLTSEFGLRGAAVVLDVHSGDIVASVSRPGFALSELTDQTEWAAAEAAERRDGFSYWRLNRVVSGYYPPGSAFKALTVLAALDSGEFSRRAPVFDYRSGEKGPRPADGVRQLGRWHEIRFEDGPPISCGNHPDLEDWRFDLESALAWSCNVAFAEIAVAVGAERLVELSRRLGFEREIEVAGMGQFRSTLDNDADKATGERFLAKRQSDLARTAFGQGQHLTTPLQMALLAAAIANGGKVMRPRLILGWRGMEGPLPDGGEPEVLHDASLRPAVAATIREIMQASVTYGWAQSAALNTDNAAPGVAGKTGSAEWSEDVDATHAWFIGYFPTERPQVALAVIVERGGAGPVVATRVAKHVFSSPALDRYILGRNAG